MKYVTSLCLLVFLFSCAGVRETTERREQEQTTNQFDESFDPLSLEDDDITIARNPDMVQRETRTEESAGETIPEPASERSQVDGWRVQILATKNIENATLVHQEASDQFELSDIKAYLIFEAPLYKVRIGNAQTRTEAETVRDLARDYGYTEAFIVRSKVLVNPDTELQRD
jgi:hypothetical protein